MDFTAILPTLVEEFDARQLRYALIGGLAMALRGVQRTTLDADFILLEDDLAACHSILGSLGYSRDFHSDNVSHYIAQHPSLGRIDLLHAFRTATLGMLQRAERLPLTPGCAIPVVHTEDLIGLKIQAACNDPTRATGDWSDIHQLIQHAGRTRQSIDWELLGDYLALFEKSDELYTLRKQYGASESS
jgi:hypothetical protein